MPEKIPPPQFETTFRSGPIERLYFAAEYLLISLCPSTGPGPLMRLVFKSGILWYRLGFGWLVGRTTLLVTTTGRKTGRPRQTPLAYRYDPAADIYYVVPGWPARSDWLLNLRKNPRVRVRVGSRETEALAEPAPSKTALEVFRFYFRRNPFAARVWSRLCGTRIEDSEPGLRELALRCPVIALHPLR